MKASFRGKLILFTTLLFLFLLFVVVKYLYLDKKNEFGQLKIISSPDASVFVDNVATGKTPFEGNYKVGTYLIKLIPQGDATESASWQGRVVVNKNSLTYVNRELGTSDLTSAGEIFYPEKMQTSPKTPNTGEILVQTDPNGAIVKLDNDEKGVASLILSDVPKGTHEINVYLPGFVPRTQKINIDEGYRVNAIFKLAIDQSLKQASPSSQLNTKEASKSAAPGSLFKVKIKDTPTGFLRVRESPSVNASEEAQLQPGQTFDVLEEQGTWYRVSYQPNKDGWISSEYTEKL